MKRLKLTVITLLLAVMLTFSGCSGKDQTQEAEDLASKLNTSFETTANIKYKNIQATVDFYKDPLGMCSVKFSSPDSLKDMKLLFEDQVVHIEYKGLSYKLDPNSTIGGAAASLIITALNAVSSKEGITFKLEDKNVLSINGIMESGTFELKLDKANGNLLKLSIPESEFEMDIVNFKFLS